MSTGLSGAEVREGIQGLVEKGMLAPGSWSRCLVRPGHEDEWPHADIPADAHVWRRRPAGKVRRVAVASQGAWSYGPDVAHFPLPPEGDMTPECWEELYHQMRLLGVDLAYIVPIAGDVGHRRVFR